jgi:hypothetical protein
MVGLFAVNTELKVNNITSLRFFQLLREKWIVEMHGIQTVKES